MDSCWSSIGKKIVTGITGLSLVMFVITHLAGNLTLLAGAEIFNAYAYFLEHLMHGIFIYFAEAGLLLLVGAHVVTGINIALRRGTARDVGYEIQGDAGAPSQKGVASTTMIISGLILFVFLVIHIIHFKYGPGERAGYVTMVDGHPARDLYRLVVEEFNKPLPTFGYVFVMLLLGLHLHHGFWSAFQSLGVGSPRLTPVIRGVGVALAALLAIGFIAIPLYIYFMVHPPAVSLGGLS